MASNDKAEQLRSILLVQIHAMIILANDRLGDENPYATLSYDDYDVVTLAVLKRQLHELLYSPPSRNR